MKIGIFRGTFDPIHEGHICLARTVVKKEICDSVVFFPEKSPRFKKNVTGFKQRCEMIKTVIEDYPAFKLLVDYQELHADVDSVFSSVFREFGNDNEYVSIMGADVFASLCCWPDAHKLVSRSSFAVAPRSGKDMKVISETQKQLPDVNAVIVNTDCKHVSSSGIRQTLLNLEQPHGIPPKIREYIKSKGLYGYKIP